MDLLSVRVMHVGGTQTFQEVCRQCDLPLIFTAFVCHGHALSCGGEPTDTLFLSVSFSVTFLVLDYISGTEYVLKIQYLAMEKRQRNDCTTCLSSTTNMHADSVQPQ
jgi:hypothetical protein